MCLRHSPVQKLPIFVCRFEKPIRSRRPEKAFSLSGISPLSAQNAVYFSIS